jgi:hypothetical protein
MIAEAEAKDRAMREQINAKAEPFGRGEVLLMSSRFQMASTAEQARNLQLILRCTNTVIR